MARRRKRPKGKPRSKTKSTTASTSSKGRPERYRLSDVRAALELTGGLQSRAAETLGCATTTIANYIARYPSLRRALDEIVERTLDLAEDAVITAIKDPSHKCHAPFTLAYLKAKGKRRGWGGTQVEVAPLGGKIAVYLPKKIPESEAPTQRVNADGSGNEGEPTLAELAEQEQGEPNDERDDVVDPPPDDAEASDSASAEPPPKRKGKTGDLSIAAPRGDGARLSLPPEPFAAPPRRRRWLKGEDGVERLEPLQPEQTDWSYDD